MTTVQREEVRPGISVLTLDRSNRLNAMSRELISDLHDVLDEIAADRECRVVMLTGAGRGFCSGLDRIRREAPAELHRRVTAAEEPDDS